MNKRHLSVRPVAVAAAASLTMALSVLTAPPSHAAGLKTCNDYIKAKHVSCDQASRVAEEGLARLLDSNATVVRFDGWTCKRPDRDADRFRCAKKAAGKTKVVKYRSS
jgi:hypothetical protein